MTINKMNAVIDLTGMNILFDAQIDFNNLFSRMSSDMKTFVLDSSYSYRKPSRVVVCMNPINPEVFYVALVEKCNTSMTYGTYSADHNLGDAIDQFMNDPGNQIEMLSRMNCLH